MLRRNRFLYLFIMVSSLMAVVTPLHDGADISDSSILDYLPGIAIELKSQSDDLLNRTLPVMPESVFRNLQSASRSFGIPPLSHSMTWLS